MPRGVATSEEVKAQVIAALLAGAGVNETARKYNLPPNTVSHLKRGLAEHVGTVGTDTRQSIDDLLLETMSVNLSALNRIAKTASEPEYVKKCGAESVAVLYREIASVTIRLLEAASAAGIGEATAAE